MSPKAETQTIEDGNIGRFDETGENTNNEMTHESETFVILWHDEQTANNDQKSSPSGDPQSHNKPYYIDSFLLEFFSTNGCRIVGIF